VKLWLDAVNPELTAERVWLDRSPALLLAVCECGWRAVATDPPAAWTALGVHLGRCHDDPASARQAGKNRWRSALRNGVHPSAP